MAGYGAFPLEIAAELHTQGIDVHIVAAREETSAEIEQYATSLCWLHVGQLGSMIRAFKQAGVSQVIFAGKVKKLHLFRNFKPDLTALKVLAKMKDLRDNTLLCCIADELNKNGLETVSQLIIPEMMANEGLICGPRLSKKSKKDIDFGYTQAKGISALDIGQTIVVQKQTVLAVEAIEGSDAAIIRGGNLGNGKAVVIKVEKPNQDQRFDVPAVGVDTLHAMHAHGCTVLAIEAKKTLILQRDIFFKMATDYKITVFGITPTYTFH